MDRPAGNRFFIGQAPVDSISLADASLWIVAELHSRVLLPSPLKPLQIMGPNAFLVTLASRNRAFAEALQGADLVLPDGMSVVWGARVLGEHVPERVPGGECMERLCAMCAERGLSVYLLGGLPGAAELAARTLKERYPELQIAGTDCPPLGFEQDEAQSAAVRARIEAAQPNLLCIALGAPKQEIWMLDEVSSLPIGAAISVGAAFDTLAGLRKRAPAWTHNIGVEWLYRLVMEPRRLWKRYLLGNLEFAVILARTWASQPSKRNVIAQQRRRGATRHASSPLPAALSAEDRALLELHGLEETANLSQHGN